jgi:hypothetical protein
MAHTPRVFMVGIIWIKVDACPGRLQRNNFTKYSNVLLNRFREIRKLENTFSI